MDEAGGAIRTITLVNGVTAADPYNVAQSQVNAGSAVVTWLDLSIEFVVDTFIASAAFVQRIDWQIFFNIAGAQSVPDPRVSGTSDLKNQIIHSAGAFIGGNTAGQTNGGDINFARVVYNIHIAIPKWAQKINKDDQIQFNYIYSDATANKCTKLKGIFMEYEQS